MSVKIAKDLIDTVAKLSALQARTEDVRKAQDRIENKLDDLINRISRVEADYAHLRESLRNQILADIKSDLVRTQLLMSQEKGLLDKAN